jgi:hypothetical protein
MIKRLLKVMVVVAAIVVAFFLLPLPGAFAPSDPHFRPEPPVPLVKTAENRGSGCRPGVVYSTMAESKFHADQGYSFTIDDYCAGVQRHLLDAISNNDIVLVRELIAAGANVRTDDYSTLERVSPIQVASSRSVEMVKLLLDNGADPNEEYCCCASCRCPLVSALDKGDPETVGLLLARGADVTYTPKFSVEPYNLVDVACSSLNAEMVIRLDNACGLNPRCRAKVRMRILSHWL